MYKGKWIFNSVAIAIATGVVLVNADRAQSIPNLSDITGTDNFSAPLNSSSFDGGGAGANSPAAIQTTSAQAESISQELSNDLTEVSQSESTPKAPRHFARKPKQDCPNPVAEKADKLKQTVSKAENFLNDANQATSNNSSNRAW